MTANSRWLRNPQGPWGALQGQVECHSTNFHLETLKGKKENFPENMQPQRTFVLNSI